MPVVFDEVSTRVDGEQPRSTEQTAAAPQPSPAQQARALRMTLARDRRNQKRLKAD